MNKLTKSCAEIIDEIRARRPLVHNITNYVSANDCANVILAIGGSPIMSDYKSEVKEIVSMSSALVLNLGTINKKKVTSMIKAGKRANKLGIPVILDPVGVGASRLRNKACQKILSKVKIDVIRGNLSEISFIAGCKATVKGVDLSEEDKGKDGLNLAIFLADKYSCVVAITGEVDVVSDGNRTCKIYNGHSLLTKVTGTGCMTSSLIGACCSVSEDYYVATITGIMSMGLAGEIAFKKSGAEGTAGFRASIIDALSQLDLKIGFKRPAY